MVAGSLSSSSAWRRGGLCARDGVSRHSVAMGSRCSMASSSCAAASSRLWMLSGARMRGAIRSCMPHAAIFRRMRACIAFAVVLISLKRYSLGHGLEINHCGSPRKGDDPKNHWRKSGAVTVRYFRSSPWPDTCADLGSRRRAAQAARSALQSCLTCLPSRVSLAAVRLFPPPAFGLAGLFLVGTGSTLFFLPFCGCTCLSVIYGQA